MSFGYARVSSTRRNSTILVAACLALGLSAATANAQTGSIEGTFTISGEGAFSGVSVSIEETGDTTLTDVNGRFNFTGLDPGAYNLSFTFDEHTAREANIAVRSHSVTTVATEAAWDVFYMEMITVRATSRRQESLTDAPGATVKITAADMESQGAAGQLPRALRFSPGVELAQSGLYNFHLNARGFNAPFNRRVLTMIDWRDSTFPGILGFQGWGLMPFSMNDIQSIELVRGPTAALYGPGAFNGVLDIRTRSPRDDPGGRVSVAIGDLDTQRYEGKYAGEIGDDWFFKVHGGYQSSDDFTRSRVGSVEYAPGQLPMEVVEPTEGRELYFAGARLDRYLEGNRHFVVELGTSTADDFVGVSPNGRTQSAEIDAPWGRLLFSTPNWNFSAFYTHIDTRSSVGLSSGAPTYFDGENVGAELQGNLDIADGRGRLVYGASAGSQEVDTRDPQGVHTVYSAVEGSDRWAVFGQADFDFTETLTGILSVRYDDSTLHGGQFSPRAALVWKPLPDHTFRLTYSDAYQRPELSQYRLRVPAAPPVDLSALETALAPVIGNVPLGFGNIPILAVGNEALTIEDIQSIELGWKATLGNNLYIEASYFRNDISNFTSNLVPNVGTSLGRINEAYGAYTPPAELSPAAATAVLGALSMALPPDLFALMSNDLDNGAPVFAAVTFGNFGAADTQGLEIGVNYAFRESWRFDLNYTWLDVDIENNLPQSPLSMNSPEHSASAGIYFANDSWDWSLRYRWVDEFLWSSGAYVGNVETYGTADFYLNYRINDSMKIGLEAANVFDSSHYELFGGDLLQRRLLAHFSYTW